MQYSITPRGAVLAKGSDGLQEPADAQLDISRFPIVRIAAGIGFLVAALGLIVMGGWGVGSRLLVQVSPTFAPMQFNTALGFMCAGAGLIGLVYARHRLVVALGSLIATIGLLTLFEYASGVDLGIDELLVTHDVTVKTSHPGRMAPTTALSFSVFGIAVLLAALRVGRERMPLILGLLATIVFGLAMASTVGYAIGLESAQDGKNFTRMAVHTSLAFLMLGAGAYVFARQQALDHDRSTTYVLSVVPVGVLSLIVVLSMWQALTLHGRNLIDEKTSQRASTLGVQVQVLLQSRTKSLERLAERWLFRGRLSTAAWQADASQYIAQHAGLQALQWADASGRVRRNMPRSGNERALGEDYTAEPSRRLALAASRQAGVAVVSKTVDLVQGGKGFLVFVPIGQGRKFDGYIVGVFRFRDVFGTVLRLGDQEEWNVAVIADGQRVYRNRPSADRVAGEWVKSVPMAISNVVWRLEVSPAKTELTELQGPLPSATLVFGALLIFLLIVTAHQTQVRGWRLREIDRLRRRNELVLQAAGEGIYGIDHDGRCVFVNSAAARLIGRRSSELIDQPHHQIFHHSRADGTPYPAEQSPILATIWSGQSSRVDDEVFWRKDGSSFPVSYVSTPMRERNGAISGAVVVFRDLTDLRRTQAELSNAVVELRAANRELEAFSYSVSHDLRAPLRAIDGFSQALVEDYGSQLDDGARGYLDRIRAASQRMGDLINDLLNLSRITRSKLERSDIDMARLAEEIVKELRDGQPEREVTVQIEPDLSTNADPRLVRVLLANLLGNAWKFTAKRRSARIDFGAEVEDGVRWYFVRDNGAGFSMEYADKLFKPFQRLHAAAEFDGTGIGLATVKRIVSRHGGKIWAEAESDSGATFYFTLNGDATS